MSLGTTALRPIGVSAVTYDAASHVFYTLYGGSDGETAVRGLGPAAETVFDRPIVEFPAVCVPQPDRSARADPRPITQQRKAMRLKSIALLPGNTWSNPRE